MAKRSKSLPSRERELKQLKPLDFTPGIQSLPSRERELKLILLEILGELC